MSVAIIFHLRIHTEKHINFKPYRLPSLFFLLFSVNMLKQHIDWHVLLIKISCVPISLFYTHLNNQARQQVNQEYIVNYDSPTRTIRRCTIHSVSEILATSQCAQKILELENMAPRYSR